MYDLKLLKMKNSINKLKMIDNKHEEVLVKILLSAIYDLCIFLR